MLDIKNKLYDVIGKLIYLIIGFIAFCIELVRHPINNISVWAIGGLACFINKYVELLLNANKMFSLSLGSLAIVFFITNYLESKVVDIDKKENFYLGFNIMRRRFHDNFWLQKFNDIPIKRFFGAIIAIPTIILCTELKYNIKILDDVTSVVNKNSRLIISIWVATFVISAFYCVAILIEAVSLSRKSFSKSALYDSSKWGEKIAIEYKVKKDFKKIFYDLFSIKYILESDVEFVTDVSNFINYIFNRAKEVSNNEEEINKYIELAFREESNVIENSLKRIIGIYGNKISNETIVAIKNYLIKKYIERLYWYFNNKWNTIKLLDIPPLILLKIARKDLRFLLEIERKLKSNDLYREIFWGKYRKHKHIILERNLLDSNLCVSQIEEILERKIEDINFLDKLNDTDIIFDILEILREIDDETKTTHYFTNIFATIYSCIYKVEMKDIKVIKEFFKKLKFKYEIVEEYSEEIPKDEVIKQDPKFQPNYMIKTGTVIKVYVSKGLEMVKVPDELDKKTVDEIKKALDDAGIKYEIVEEHSEEIGKGKLLRLEYNKNEQGEIAKKDAIKIYVSKGTAKKDVVIPKLEDLKKEEAIRKLQALNLKVTEQETYVEYKSNGIVTLSTPTAGTTVKEGTEVKIFVNKVPELIKGKIVINVAKMTGTTAATTPPTPGILSGATSTKVKVKVELDDKKIEEKEVEKTETALTIPVSSLGRSRLNVYINESLKYDDYIDLSQKTTWNIE